MIHILVILLVLSVYMGGSGADAFHGAVATDAGAGSFFTAFAFAWGPVVICGLLCSRWYARARLRLDRSGSAALWEWADRAAGLMRLFLTLHTAGLIVVGGWLGAVRSVVGDPPVLDELLAISGALAFYVWAWWSQSALERRVREAGIVRALDEGRPVWDLPSRGRLTWLQVRHHLLIVLIPLLLIRLWSESVGLWLRGAGGREFLVTIESRLGVDPSVTIELVVLPGVLLVLLLMPLLLRPLWQARPLPGGLGEEIRAMAANARVRLGGLLSWNTSSTMINAMVVGPVWPFRQVMFSDALLERVPRDRVLAVAAHEIAHIRFHHLLWLMLGGGAAIVLTSAVATLLGSAFGRAITILSQQPLLGSGAAILFQLAGTFVGLGALFGVVISMSRRFEWQADAYAAVVMTKRLQASDPHSPHTHGYAVSRAGAIVMINALAQVAALNGVSPTRPAWRHGSIALRQRRLVRLASERTARPLIDLQVRMLKSWVLAALIVGVTLSWLASP